MSSLQYFHCNNQQHDPELISYTAVVEVPTLIQTLNLINDYVLGKQQEVLIRAAVTIVNPKDQYCKKTGRNMALLLARSQPFKLQDINFSFGRTKLTLTCQNLNNKIGYIELEIASNRSKPYLTYVSIDNE